MDYSNPQATVSANPTCCKSINQVAVTWLCVCPTGSVDGTSQQGPGNIYNFTNFAENKGSVVVLTRKECHFLSCAWAMVWPPTAPI